MVSEGDTLLSSCYLLLTRRVQSPSKFKIQIGHSYLVLLDLFISKGEGEKINIYMPKERKELSVGNRSGACVFQ